MKRIQFEVLASEIFKIIQDMEIADEEKIAAYKVIALAIRSLHPAYSQVGGWHDLEFQGRQVHNVNQ